MCLYFLLPATGIQVEQLLTNDATNKANVQSSETVIPLYNSKIDDVATSGEFRIRLVV